MQQGVVFLDGLFDRTAILVAEHYQQTYAEYVHRVVQGSDHSVVDDLARGAYGEQIADTCVEDDIGTYACVGAT